MDRPAECFEEMLERCLWEVLRDKLPPSHILFRAVLQRDTVAAEDCLKNGSDEEDYKAALKWVIQDGNSDTLQLLLKHKPSFTIERGQDTPLHWAAKDGSAEICQLLLTEFAYAIYRRDNKGSTPLFYATHDNGIVEVLLTAGSKVNSRNYAGDTPLMIACKNGHVAAVRTLVGAGAPVDSFNHRRVTPLMVTAKWPGTCCGPNDSDSIPNSQEIAQLLLRSGASASLKYPGTGLATVHYVAKAENAENLLQIIIECGCDLEVRCEAGLTPLIYAILDVRPVAVRHLIQAGCQIDYDITSFGHNCSRVFSVSRLDSCGDYENLQEIPRRSDHLDHMLNRQCNVCDLIRQYGDICCTPFQLAVMLCDQLIGSLEDDDPFSLTDVESNYLCSLLRIIHMLVFAGAKVSSQDEDTYTALETVSRYADNLDRHWCGRHGHHGVIQEVKESVNRPDTLVELSRFEVRASLGQNIRQHLDAFMIPALIQKIILLDGIERI